MKYKKNVSSLILTLRASTCWHSIWRRLFWSSTQWGGVLGEIWVKGQRNYEKSLIWIVSTLKWCCGEWEAITWTYHVSFGRRDNAFVRRGSGKLYVGYGGRGFCGMSRAGMGWCSSTLLFLLILFIYGLPTLPQLLVHIVQKIHNFFHGNRQLGHKCNKWLRSWRLPQIWQVIL